MSYTSKDYEKTQSAEVSPVTHADEASSKWAAAHNYRTRCEIDRVESTTRHEQAVAAEHEAWNQLEVTAGRAPPSAVQGVPPSLRAQNGRLG